MKIVVLLGTKQQAALASSGLTIMKSQREAKSKTIDFNEAKKPRVLKRKQIFNGEKKLKIA